MKTAKVRQFGGRILSAQACALDAAPSRAGRIFAVAFSDHRNSAGHCRQSRWSNWPREFLASPVLCKRSLRLPCWHCLFLFRFSGSVFARRLCAVPLRVIADRAEHCEWFAGHSRSLRESAIALGLSRFIRLWKIYLPMASRSILSGIKTSAVINVGTATSRCTHRRWQARRADLERPQFERSRHDLVSRRHSAALLALVVQWLFDVLDRVLIPKGLRI